MIDFDHIQRIHHPLSNLCREWPCVFAPLLASWLKFAPSLDVKGFRDAVSHCRAIFQLIVQWTVPIASESAQCTGEPDRQSFISQHNATGIVSDRGKKYHMRIADDVAGHLHIRRYGGEDHNVDEERNQEYIENKDDTEEDGPKAIVVEQFILKV